jgi:hypothetical protein
VPGLFALCDVRDSNPEPADSDARLRYQICALPPSTNSSMPVTKLESSEARNSAALATSSGSPMRPIGMVDAIFSMVPCDCAAVSGVAIGPGLRGSSLFSVGYSA